MRKQEHAPNKEQNKTSEKKSELNGDEKYI